MDASLEDRPSRQAWPQYTSRVLMVRPSRFGFNEETAPTNRFQTAAGRAEQEAVHEQALREFDGMQAELDTAGVDVLTFEDEPAPHKPDALFPNNWVSFHADGSIVYYPMFAANRRKEIRRDWIVELERKLDVHWHRELDLTSLGARGQFLEGTGSMILDRQHGVGFAGVSPRTHPAALATFAEHLHYEIIPFGTRDATHGAIYHTNVMMELGKDFAVLCLEAIATEADQVRVLETLERLQKQVIRIRPDQMECFAGNQLALENRQGDPLIALSTRALGSLDPSQVKALEKHGRLLAVPLDTIENHGGGSARCMLAELHLPQSSGA